MQLIQVTAQPDIVLELPRFSVRSKVSSIGAVVPSQPTAAGFQTDAVSTAYVPEKTFFHTGTYKLGSRALATDMIRDWEALEGVRLTLHRGEVEFQDYANRTIKDTISAYITSAEVVSEVQKSSTVYRLTMTINFKSTDPAGWVAS